MNKYYFECTNDEHSCFVIHDEFESEDLDSALEYLRKTYTDFECKFLWWLYKQSSDGKYRVEITNDPND